MEEELIENKSEEEIKENGSEEELIENKSKEEMTEGREEESRTDPEVPVKKKPRKFIAIIIAAVIILIAAAGLLIYHNSPEQKIKRQIALGDRYLGELEYEKAVAAYKVALEIDPARNDISEMVGTTYVQWGNSVLNAQNYTGAYELYKNAGEYGKTEEAEYGMVSCTLMEADDLYARGERDEAITKIVSYKLSVVDTRLSDKLKEFYIRWADDLRDQGEYEKEIDKLFELLDDQIAADILDRLKEACYRYIDTLLPEEEEDPDARQKAYGTIIGLLNQWVEKLKKLGVDATDPLILELLEEVSKYSDIYGRCYQEKKLYNFRKADAADADEYAVILETIRARYGAELYSLNMVEDSNRESENKKPGLKEVFAQCNGSKAVTVYEKHGLDTVMVKSYIYDLYLADLNEKTIKRFKHGEFVQRGGGNEIDVDGEIIHYTYSGENAFAEEQENAKKEYMKWFTEKTNATINEKEICIYCYGEDRMEGWDGIPKEWKLAFIASDDKYYEAYFYVSGTKKWMTCSQSSGKLMSKDEKWEE